MTDGWEWTACDGALNHQRAQLSVRNLLFSPSFTSLVSAGATALRELERGARRAQHVTGNPLHGESAGAVPAGRGGRGAADAPGEIHTSRDATKDTGMATFWAPKRLARNSGVTPAAARAWSAVSRSVSWLARQVPTGCWHAFCGRRQGKQSDSGRDPKRNGETKRNRKAAGSHHITSHHAGPASLSPWVVAQSHWGLRPPMWLGVWAAD